MATSPEGTCQSDLPVFSFWATETDFQGVKNFCIEKEHAKPDDKERETPLSARDGDLKELTSSGAYIQFIWLYKNFLFWKNLWTWMKFPSFPLTDGS